jgi:hypothetical protein
MIKKLDYADLKVPQDTPCEHIIAKAIWEKINEVVDQLNMNITLQNNNQSLINYIENLKFSDNKTIQALNEVIEKHKYFLSTMGLEDEYIKYWKSVS